jgi:diguanylate cyclase (GGDEF)-like protein
MSDATHTLIRTVLLAVLTGFLLAAGRGGLKADVTGRGWWMIFFGFVLMFAGSIAELLLKLPALKSLSIYSLQTEGLTSAAMICGFAFIGTSLLRAISGAIANARTAKLNLALSKAKGQLVSGQALLRGVLQSSLSGVMVVKALRDEGGSIVDLVCELMNSACEQVLGRPVKDLLGKALARELPGVKTEGLLRQCISVIETGLPFNDVRNYSFVGGKSWLHTVAVKLGDGCAITFTDVTDRKKAEEQLRHAAHHDVLTGLANRARFIERLEQTLHRAQRYAEYKFAVLFLDFDRFKIINDSLGHEVGDGLLISIADRLRSKLDVAPDIAGSSHDEGHLAARLGGDEFVILLDQIASEKEALMLAEQLLEVLAKPHQIDEHKVTSTASIGIVTCDSRYAKPDDIIRDADTAMYEAKKAGRARYVIFDQRMHKEVVHRLNLEKDLRDAVEKEQFELAYEPIVSLESGELAGFEALVRWTHPQRGPIKPLEFISLAEELGLIGRIGEWVLRGACKQLKQWHTNFPHLQQLTMNVNLSKQQLTHPDLIGTIKRVFDETQISRRCLRLEITESMVSDSRYDLTPVLQSLKDLGLQLAMDDFGTGQSSLSCLHRFPIDVLKIDQSFINSMGHKRAFAAIVHVIVELAHNLDMEVVAEGIEKQEHLSLLQGLNCNFGQGRLFGEALTATEANNLVARGFRYKMAA